MNLTDLDPEFVSVIDAKQFQHVDSIEQADGIRFLCPLCYQRNGGPIGVHSVLCWKPSVQKDITPGPGRWDMQGSGFNDLTLVAGSSSVRLTDGCEAHFFIKNGKIIMC